MVNPEKHKELEQRALDEAEAEKEALRLQGLWKPKNEDEVVIPVRDDLRLKSLAKYQALRDGDVLQCEVIDNKLSNQAEMKGLAFHSPSMERFQKLKDDHLLDSNNLSLEGSQDI